ncbi:unnamed protein product [Cylicocyclus nassatus]|uniref:Uncharacterized protein n=1 Tax=Cylicocyclus nassatus TaxID=53992 RepID=A0AA36GN73_CYLNA|nr:unnamed protein product [Cylicocyclus nassatus]
MKHLAVYPDLSTRQASPVERKIHERRLLAKIKEVKEQKQQLGDNFKCLLIATAEKEVTLKKLRQETKKAQLELEQLLSCIEKVISLDSCDEKIRAKIISAQTYIDKNKERLDAKNPVDLPLGNLHGPPAKRNLFNYLEKVIPGYKPQSWIFALLNKN